MKILNYIISVYFWTWTFIMQVLMFPVAAIIWALTFWFDRRLRTLHMFACFWGGHHIWMNPFWRLKVTGRKNIRNDQAYVLVSNHQSFLDIMILYNLFRHFKWVSKESNFRIPFSGWNMRLNKYIELKRSDRKSIILMIRECIENINNGNSVFIFPEGSRSKDGEIRKFKEGAFAIAIKTKSPIVPIVLDGSSKVMSSKGLWLNAFTQITVKILEPVPYKDIEGLKAAEVSQKIHDIIQSELSAMRAIDV